MGFDAGAEIAETSDFALDADATLRAVGAPIDWLVVDSYNLDARWHARARAAGALRICVIDDLANRALLPDLLVDHNPSASDAKKYEGRLGQACPVLGGPRFALVGPQFLDVRPYEVRREVESVGVFFGGGATAESALAAVKGCRAVAGYQGAIEVVVSSRDPGLGGLFDLAQNDSLISVSLDLDDLCAFFGRHDLQIGGGGGAVWERCRVGVPTLAIAIAANQAMTIPWLVENGIVAGIAAGSAPTPAAIGVAFRALVDDAVLRQSLARRSRGLIDGLGAARVAMRMLGTELHVRPALMSDAGLLFAWRNDELTRRMSRNSAPLSEEGHGEWLSRTLRSPNRWLLVGVLNDRPVGVIRFDEGETGFEVSLYLDPNLHGLGLGTRLLLSGEAYMTMVRRAGTFVAEVLPSNAGSRQLFLKAGYLFHSNVGKKEFGNRGGSDR